MKYFWLLTLFFICCHANAYTQEADLVPTNGMLTALHRENAGKIFFTERKMDQSALQKEHFLANYTLTNKSDLFFVAYFNNSLTNYQHRLSPGISGDSLHKAGNYQFTLFVDDREIYRSNLLPGAPSAINQEKETMLNRPLLDNKNGQGSWSESFWNRFLMNGGDSALTDGKHMLRMEIRPYVKTDILQTGPVMASGTLQLLVARHPAIDISTIRLRTPTPYNGFPVSNEAFDNRRIRALKGAINEGIFRKINSIVVIKNGRLLIEEYFNGDDRNTLHDPRSVGKSFASTLTGQAIKDGFLKNEMQPLGDFYQLAQFQNFNTLKEKTTLKDLLTMSAGFNGNDEDYSSPGNEENMYPTDNWVKFTLDLPFNDSLKTKWHYFTAGVIVLGDVLQKSVPGGLEKYAADKLFTPLGITNYKWQYTPQHVPNTAGGIQMNALDFAKYGQLYKNNGVWNRQQILPKEWVEKTFTKQLPITGRNNEYYGYLFWNKQFTAGKKAYEAFYCAGNGGNYILVFKDQPLVIVITASAYGQFYAHSQVATILSDYLLPALVQ